MKFRPVFYMISGWPSIEKTKEMVDKYIAHGVCAPVSYTHLDVYKRQDYDRYSKNTITCAPSKFNNQLRYNRRKQGSD